LVAWSCEHRAQVTALIDAKIAGPVQAIRQDVERESDPALEVLEPARARACFDDPNLVSRAGLVPVMSLAGRAGLACLVREHVKITAKAGVFPEVKIGCLVAGMAAGADSIDDMDLLRHGAMPDLFGGVRAPSTLGSFLRSFSWAMSGSWRRRAGNCWPGWPAWRRCCRPRISSRSWTLTRCSGESTGIRSRARRSGTPRSPGRQCWCGG
jgi:hypothetical protein